jgi:uncharacterized RDD family membrane protein YckC
MKCTVCEKTFAATLSVCPSCGAMASQHNSFDTSLRVHSIERITTSDLELEIGDAPDNRRETALRDFDSLRQTKDKTLLEFPTKKPEWRDEIKNIVEQRRQSGSTQTAVSDETALIINLKPKLDEKKAAKVKNVVADALARIERSRRKYEDAEQETESDVDFLKRTLEKESKAATVAKADLPLKLVSPRKVLPMIEDDSIVNLTELPAKNQNIATESPTKTEKPLESAAFDEFSSFDDFDAEAAASALRSVRKVSAAAVQPPLAQQDIAERAYPNRQKTTRSRRVDDGDYAPLVPRFVGGAIDLAFCAAASAAILYFGFDSALFGATSQPLVFLFLIAAFFFVYATVCLLLFGATIGLRIFGLSVVRAEDGGRPTAGQIIINNGIYLASLLFAGIGLLPALFGIEKRAAHNWLSGTVVVKE